MRGKGLLLGIGALILVLIIGFNWYVRGVNRIVTIHEQVPAAWSQIETQLQRRADLVPNLVETVRGYAKHEEQVFTEVAELRSRWTASAGNREAQIENAKEMSGALSRLLVVAEQYPELKANENFLTLQAQLEGTENRISVERHRYNDAVRAFNTEQRTFFGNFFAGRRGLTKPEPYFETEAASREAPQVQF
jgi:LemA protein